MATKGLVARLKDGETVILAEGYLFEFERRGYLKAGAFVPEVVLEHPQLVKSLYGEFVHCGSDVVLAFTYYAHRAKLEVVNRQTDIEALNRKALKLAREVADETGTLMAGNICNTTVWEIDNKESHDRVRSIFKEQIGWAVDEGADFILGESFPYGEEAMVALECIKAHGKGLPAVINLFGPSNGKTLDGIPIEVMCKRLEEAGAVAVGLNCALGPATIMKHIQKVRKTCNIPISCLPVPFRTSEEYPTMITLPNNKTGKKAFPDNLIAWQCTRSEIEEFTLAMKENNIQLIGLCCGNMGSYIRTMAETLGRKPKASKYSPDMNLHLSQISKQDSKFFNKLLD